MKMVEEEKNEQMMTPDLSIDTDVTEKPSKDHQKKNIAFMNDLDEEGKNYFTALLEKSFSEQAITFLNAYWPEIGDQAEFIYSMAWHTFKEADMHTQGMSYVHMYDESSKVDFNVAMYFYEKLCKKVHDSEEHKEWRMDEKYKKSLPQMKTAIARKKELRDKVDVTFDGKVSFIEYLLYQYRDHIKAEEFADRCLRMDEDHPEVLKAKIALEKVNEAIKTLEKEKDSLRELAEKGGVKGMGAKHELAIIEAGTLSQSLDRSLISAEAAVRLISKQFAGDSARSKALRGSVWWMKKDLEEKKKLYAKKSKK